MNYLDWFKEFYAKHPGMVIGGVGGAALGFGFAVFGFWRTVIVVACVGLGLFLGLRVDGGDDVFSWPERVKAFFKRK